MGYYPFVITKRFSLHCVFTTHHETNENAFMYKLYCINEIFLKKNQPIFVHDKAKIGLRIA